MQFFGLPSLTKGDRYGIGTSPRYYLDAVSDNEKGNTCSYGEVGGPKQVYLTVLKLIATFLQSIEKGRYKGLGTQMRGSRRVREASELDSRIERV